MPRKDYLNMSDEDILNMEAPEFQEAAVEENEEPEDTEENVKSSNEDVETEDGSVDEDDADQAEDESQESDDGDADEEAQEANQKAETTEAHETDKPKKTADETAVVNYEAEYKRLLAPFKANGRDVEVKSVDDAITLMQMGANYNKKMAALKPNLKVLKLLENNGLLDETKLSYLIDLDRKNPDAINKLVKDSGLDPMDFDAEKASEYRPKIHTVDDREIDLDTVLDEIQNTATYTRTLGIVSKEWDGSSKQVVAEHPQLLKVINDHVQRGIYDIISAEVERERMFGRLTGLSDLDAYRQIGDAIQARGGFNHLSSPQEENQYGKPVVVQPKPKKADDDKLKEKKRAASLSKSSISGSGDADFNPLSMSDEEFAKLASKRYR